MQRLFSARAREANELLLAEIELPDLLLVSWSVLSPVAEWLSTLRNRDGAEPINRDGQEPASKREPALASRNGTTTFTSQMLNGRPVTCRQLG